MSIDHIISEIYDLRIEEVILLGDSTVLLDYGHQFIRSLHAMNSKSQTRVLSRCYLHKVFECS